MKICIVTYHGDVEPRGPRHALAARLAFPDAKVEFIHYRPTPASDKHTDVPVLRGHDIDVTPLYFPTRDAAFTQLAFRKAKARASQLLHATTGKITESFYGIRCQGLTRELLTRSANIYFAHNIETLLPAAHAAARHRAALMFDCMEYYSDMGSDGHPPHFSHATRHLEASWLPRCALVVASSTVMAEFLAKEYSITRPVPSYNAAPRLEALPPKYGGGLNLYWRNYVLGFGPRGLDDALQALQFLPTTVRLFIQGLLPSDGGAVLKEKIDQLGLTERVTILPPHGPGDAVKTSAQYDIGLCLEHRTNRNHELTVSNKMFDYLMGGLAVVASDLPGLSSVIERSGGGLVFEPGNVTSLVSTINRLHQNPQLLAEFQNRARSFALAEGNREYEVERVALAMRTALARHPSASANRRTRVAYPSVIPNHAHRPDSGP